MPEVHERDIVYGDADGRRLTATYYEPASPNPAAPHALLVDVHGGAWTMGDRRSHQHLDRALAALGHRVFAIDFRHGPDFDHPSAIRDIVAGVRYVRLHADALGADPAQVGLLGSSSGGHLVLLAGLRPNAAEHRGTTVVLDGGGTTPADDVDASVSHVVALWPVSDPLRRYRYAREGGRDDLADRHLQYFADEADMERAAVQHVLRAGEAEHVPAAFVAQPGADLNVPLPMTLDLIDAYQGAGGILEYVFYPGLPHAFARDDSAETHDLARAVGSFVERRVTAEWAAAGATVAPAAASAPAGG